MKRNPGGKFFSMLIMVLVCCALGLSFSTKTQAQKTRTAARADISVTQQPLYTEYKGVRLGMAAAEVRAKLGQPALKGDEQDFFVLSDNESAQIGYDAAHKVMGISVDYLGGVGAPDYKAVVGMDLEAGPNGSLYRMVRYEGLGFWVSYNRTAGPVATVTVTIQKQKI